MAGSNGPQWTGGNMDRRVLECGSALTGVGTPATLWCGSSLAGAGNGEWSMGVPFRASPRLGQRCGGRETVTKWWQRRSSMATVLKLRGRGKREGVAW
jgi:hypothetical protein